MPPTMNTVEPRNNGNNANDNELLIQIETIVTIPYTEANPTKDQKYTFSNACCRSLFVSLPEEGRIAQDSYKAVTSSSKSVSDRFHSSCCIAGSSAVSRAPRTGNVGGGMVETDAVCISLKRDCVERIFRSK